MTRGNAYRVYDDDNDDNDDDDDDNDDDDDICQGTPVTRGNAYRVYVAAFLLTLGPFTFFNLSKTKYLQVVIIIIN